MVVTLIKNAKLMDPGTNTTGDMDILIEDNKIISVGKNLNPPQEYQIYDATGLIACPGLIDLHVHVYEHSTELGINVDEYCLKRGVTTVLDAGSAGASTFPGLKKYVMETSKTRVKALLHIANHGLASAGCASITTGGECDSLNQINIDQCVNCIEKYPEDIVGIKLRLSASACNDGKNENEVYKRALEASVKSNKPLMTHHAFSTVPVSTKSGLGCPGSLKKGDIYTHMHHSYINKNGKVEQTFIDARSRGVLLDVGHGMGSFSWENAEVCAKYNFWPDTISTDLHSLSCYHGPAYDLVTVMSKFLHMGMPLMEIIRSVTITPAKVMKLDNIIGSLETNKEVDITLLRINDVSMTMEDCYDQRRIMKKNITPVVVWKAGVQYYCK